MFSMGAKAFVKAAFILKIFLFRSTSKKLGYRFKIKIYLSFSGTLDTTFHLLIKNKSSMDRMCERNL